MWGVNVSEAYDRNGSANAPYDSDRDAKSNLSNAHYHCIMEEWGFNNPVEHDESIVLNRYKHTDYYYDNVGVQKKAIKCCNFHTVTIPAHLWNKETPFAPILFHGYYDKSDPTRFVRAFLVDVNILRTIKPCGTRTNWTTGTEFHYWNYSVIQSAILNKQLIGGQ